MCDFMIANIALSTKNQRIMKLGEKKITVIISIISIVLFAAYIGLREAGIIGEGWSWLLLVIVGAAAIAVKLIQKRVDPEAYKAGLKEMEIEDKAAEEISHLPISRTWGGTVCEFITAIMLIISWILILRDYQSLAQDADSLKIAGLCTVGAIWFHVTAYFHKTMGFPSFNVKQLKMCIYRKRALGMICALFLFCGLLIPDGSKVGEWFLIVMGFSFVLIFGSKFIMNYVKEHKS